MRHASLVTLGLSFALLAGASAVLADESALADLAERGDRAGVRDLLDRRADPNQAQVDRAMAHVMLPSLLYREQRYRLAP